MLIYDSNVSQTLIDSLRRAQSASFALSKTSGSARSRALQTMATAIQQQRNEILEANTLDLEASRELGVSELISHWLKLTPERIDSTVQILKRLGELPNPIGRVVGTPYQLEQRQTYYQLVPLGVVALVYEAFPELAVIAAGLCLKTANSLLLLSSNESLHSSQAIIEVIQNALEDAGMPLGCVELLPPELEVLLPNLVVQERYLDLIIPYGRPHLVQQVVKQATVPVLRSAMGNCYLYWSATATVDLVRWMILESHTGTPDPVNAIEKVLIDPQQKSSFLTRLWNSLKEEGFDLRGDQTLVEAFPELNLADPVEWSKPYLNRTIAFRFVNNLEEGIAWMNQYSNGHANCLATESYSESRQFALDMNSAFSFINSSPKFSRHQNRGDAIFLGMSNQAGYRRGLIGLESLTSLKSIVQGNFQL
ncbi:MAG: glutamate-5-semialdehyde dehydrogenase [Microcoleaceae cyanobacterium]